MRKFLLKLKNLKEFDLASIKLTFYYLLIAMSISISFSVAIFQISSNELDRGLGRQTGLLRDIQINQLMPRTFPDLDQLRKQQLGESNHNLELNLIYFNLLVLIVSAIASYLLAKRTLKPIEEAFESQNRFTADASHELRTPLTAMRSEIEVNLRDKQLGLTEAKSLLQSNLEEISKLENLSNALLKLARSDGKQKESFTTLSLEETITESYEKIENLANAKEIEFKTNLSDVPVLGDKQSLVELFVVLLDNAIKYSPRGSRIKIDVKRDDGHVDVTIKDNGHGIKASDLPHIYERFFRSDPSRSKEKIDGYGLGLSIAKSIVDTHSGTIKCSSNTGKGTEFVVRLHTQKA